MDDLRTKEGAGRSIEAIVQDLLDREAIRDLPQRYCHHVWRRDAVSVANMYTEDGTMENEAGLTKGRDALVEFYRRAFPASDPHPFIHNHVFEIQGDTARGTCYAENRRVRGGRSFISASYYDDEYVKVAGEWKFRSRTVHTYYDVPLAQGWAETASGGA